jgi:hypothetical protein
MAAMLNLHLLGSFNGLPRALGRAMSEPVRSVMLAGTGELRWPGGEQRVKYRVSIGFDAVIGRVHVEPQDIEILRRPSRHQGIFLHTPEGRRLALNVSPNGYLSPDGPIERSLDGQDWWTDRMPWLQFETPDRYTLAMKVGGVQVFESHATAEEAEAAYRTWNGVEMAEIRPPFGRPIEFDEEISKGRSA